MATLSYVKDRRRWRIRWRATNQNSGQVFAGSKVFAENEKIKALKFYAEIESQEMLWRNGDVTIFESLNTARDNFFEHCKTFTESTRKHYVWTLNRFMRQLPKSLTRVQQIKSRHIQDYLYALHSTNAINRTLNSQLTVIKSFCRFCSERYGITNPATTVKMLKEDPPNARFIEPDEYEKIIDAANDMARDRLVFIANTGLRASEFCSVTWNCISHNTVTIVGKGRKQRTVPLNETCLGVLRRQRCRHKTQHIFLNRRSKPTTPNALLLQCHRLAKAAGVNPFGPHALRHYFATQLLIKGVPLIIVSKLMGHSNVITTQKRYTHILDKDIIGVTTVLD